MPACPGPSPEPLPSGLVLFLAASAGEPVPSYRADPRALACVLRPTREAP
jgi:hypothetical protein